MENKNFTNNTLALVCARGGSKGLKSKNLILLNKKPLIYFAINKILKNKLNYNCLSSDDKNIVKTSIRYGLKSFFIRPKKLASSNISKLAVWKHALEKAEIYYKKKFEFLLDVEVTNPLTTPKDLNNFLNKFNKVKNNYDGMFCVRDSWKNPYFNILIKKNDKFYVANKLKNNIASRQLAPKTYDHIAALYIFKTSYIRDTQHFLDGKLASYKLPLLKSIDIDDKEDFELVKKIIKK
jgi:CMP-N,N'-diacetyllegionaminic acid synthase